MVTTGAAAAAVMAMCGGNGGWRRRRRRCIIWHRRLWRRRRRHITLASAALAAAAAINRRRRGGGSASSAWQRPHHPQQRLTILTLCRSHGVNRPGPAAYLRAAVLALYNVTIAGNVGGDSVNGLVLGDGAPATDLYNTLLAYNRNEDTPTPSTWLGRRIGTT
jgi:hypothetical protein